MGICSRATPKHTFFFCKSIRILSVSLVHIFFVGFCSSRHDGKGWINWAENSLSCSLSWHETSGRRGVRSERGRVGESVSVMVVTWKNEEGGGGATEWRKQKLVNVLPNFKNWYVCGVYPCNFVQHEHYRFARVPDIFFPFSFVAVALSYYELNAHTLQLHTHIHLSISIYTKRNLRRAILLHSNFTLETGKQT